MKKGSILFFLLLQFFFCLQALSQEHIIDSLKQVLNGSTAEDTIKLKTLIELSGVCPEEEILEYALPASTLAQKLLASKDLKTRQLAKHAFAESCNNIGYAYLSQGDIASSLQFNNKSLALRKEMKDNKGIATSLVNIGYILEQKGDIPSALENYHKALPYYEAAKDMKGMAYALNNIGFIYQRQDDLSKALEYYTRSMKMREEVKDKHGISQSLTNIASIYKNQKNYDKALETHLKSLEIQEELGDKYGKANSFNNIGYIYENWNDIPKALEYYQKSLSIRESIGEKKGTANSLNNVGRIYLLKNDLNKALECAQRSFKLSNELGFPENIKNASNLLASIYKKQGKYKEAIGMFELYLKMNDSINNESIRKNAVKQQLKYEYGRKAIADSVKYAESQKVKDAEIIAQKSQIEQDKVKRWALFGGLFLVIIFAGFIFQRFRISQEQKAIIESQKKDVETQKEIIEEKQKEIVDSINYAKRIQYTLLAHQELLEKNIPKHFVLFRPKDIVSGDFYWATQREERFYLAVCDSTGHGVPGAFMSLLNTSFINEAINEKNIVQPNEIFNYVRDRLIASVSQDGAQDGMDGILLCIDRDNGKVTYAAANNTPVLIRNNKLIKQDADKMPIGKGEKSTSFGLYSLDVQKEDMLHLYTDGYADQFGGPKGKKFKYNKLNEMLIENSQLGIREQYEKLSSSFDSWKGNMEQVDDVLVIGIRI